MNPKLTIGGPRTTNRDRWSRPDAMSAYRFGAQTGGLARFRRRAIALPNLGHAARRSGSAVRAEQAYAAARDKLPSGGRASYGLGLVAFDQRGDYVAAARWFETYLREQPNGLLREEARALKGNVLRFRFPLHATRGARVPPVRAR